MSRPAPGEHGINESFDGIPRKGLLGREKLDTLLGAKVLIKRWCRE